MGSYVRERNEEEDEEEEEKKILVGAEGGGGSVGWGVDGWHRVHVLYDLGHCWGDLVSCQANQ